KTDEKNKTATITISGTVAIWTKDKNITQAQMQTAAQNQQDAINRTWTGTFTRDGITYTVSAQVTVSAAHWNDEKGAMASGSDNVIEIDNANQSSSMNLRGIFASESAPDTGKWDLQEGLKNTQEAGHEFGHGMGIPNRSAP